MGLPKAFLDDSDLGMCYEKKVIMNEQAFFAASAVEKANLIARLLVCMDESNSINKHDFPWFQVRVRPTRLYERPEGICFELRWGDRELLPNEEDTNAKTTE